MKKINHRVTGIIFVLGMLYSLSENGKKQATYDLKEIRQEYKHYWITMHFDDVCVKYIANGNIQIIGTLTKSQYSMEGIARVIVRMIQMHKNG